MVWVGRDLIDGAQRVKKIFIQSHTAEAYLDFMVPRAKDSV